MSHNLLFIGFLSVLPLVVFLCVLMTCSRAVTSHDDPDQASPPLPTSTQTDQQPVIPKRRSRTQDTLRSEYELSTYQKPILKSHDGQDNWMTEHGEEKILYSFSKTTKCQITNILLACVSQPSVTFFTARCSRSLRSLGFVFIKRILLLPGNSSTVPGHYLIRVGKSNSRAKGLIGEVTR